MALFQDLAGHITTTDLTEIRDELTSSLNDAVEIKYAQKILTHSKALSRAGSVPAPKNKTRKKYDTFNKQTRRPAPTGPYNKGQKKQDKRPKKGQDPALSKINQQISNQMKQLAATLTKYNMKQWDNDFVMDYTRVG